MLFFCIGLFFSDGVSYMEQRRFALRHLSNFGYGKTSSENLIYCEIYYLIEVINSQAQKFDGVVDFCEMFNLSMVNTLWAFVGGERFQHDDPKLKELVNAVGLFFNFSPSVIAIPFPKFLIDFFSSLIQKLYHYPMSQLKSVQQFVQVRLQMKPFSMSLATN